MKGAKKAKRGLKKANNWKVDQAFLDARVNRAKNNGFGKAKWIEFCEKMMEMGFNCYLYEARQTFSKYITVTRKNNTNSYKVRFSNHKPIKHREMAGDCDFFVGICHQKTTTTPMAIEAVVEFFKEKTA